MIRLTPLKLPLFTLLAGCGLLLGCAGEPRHANRPDGLNRAQHQATQQARAEALAASGYQPAETAALAVALQQWVLRGETLALSLAYPSSGRALPLIVYLPGLGESAQAGARWREAWARAGYAVLCLQPLAEDAQAWSSELARAADFKALGRHHYDSGRLPARVQMVEAALSEARRRAAAGDTLWSRVDFGRMAVAGYELGAQTALALAQTDLPIRATIALSPLTSQPAQTAALLSIGSARDSDPLGLFNPAQAARQLFEQAPSSSAPALLWLHNVGHAGLAGSGLSGLSGDESADGPRGGGEPRSHASESGRGRPSGGAGMGGGGKGRGGSGETGRRGAASPPAAAEPGNAETTAAITVTSLAFLDARLRQRPEAQAWLDQQAQPWLHELGEWQQR